MGTMQGQLEKAGYKLSPDEEIRVKTSLGNMRKKMKTTVCRKCGEAIKFGDLDSRNIPHDLDGNPHWQTCPYSSFAQKKAAFDIMKKLAVLFIVKLGINLEDEARLTKTEVQVVQAILERVFKDDIKEVAAKPAPGLEQDDGRVDSDIPFTPEPCDPIGDPDEERAPNTDLVHAIEETWNEDLSLEKNVELALGEGTILAKES